MAARIRRRLRRLHRSALVLWANMRGRSRYCYDWDGLGVEIEFRVVGRLAAEDRSEFRRFAEGIGAHLGARIAEQGNRSR